uniref:Uncharacterized protein n=1 Tax=Arcella intermedia TaxID=1963864 RepID=A0A6B2LN78_9EUKA
MGAVCALGLSSVGSSIATAGKAQRLQELRERPRGDDEIELTLEKSPRVETAGEDVSIVKRFVGIVIAGMPAIYGLIITVMILARLNNSHTTYTDSQGFKDLGAGLTVGLCAIASGYALSIIKPAFGKQFTTTVLLDIYAEAIALYGLIGALLFSS